MIQIFELQKPKETDNIKYKLLIIPGYIIGLNCLILVTYRTFIAFFSESKSVLININKFGEQYLDLFALVILWIITLIGLIILILILKEERETRKGNYKAETSIFQKKTPLSNIDNKMGFKIDKSEIKGLIVDSVKIEE